MRIVESNCTKPEYNLALEEYLCGLEEREGTEFFMLWRNKPSIIVGRFQNVSAEVNIAFADARNIPIIRRDSGGGAVYHDLGNVNYSFITRECRRHGFAPFANRVINVLVNAGVKAELSLNGNDITANGLKFSGMAQCRHSGTLLCHGTLLFDCDLDVMSTLLTASDEKLCSHGVKSVRSRVTNLKPFIPHVADTEDFMELLRREFLKECTLFALSAAGKDMVERLAIEKYSVRSWNLEGRHDVPEGEDV